MDNIENKIIEILESCIGINLDIEGCKNVSLLDLGVDSIVCIRFFHNIQEEFDIEIPLKMIHDSDWMIKIYNYIRNTNFNYE